MPSDEELGRLREGQLLIGFLQPLSNPEGINRLAGRGVTAFAMESIPAHHPSPADGRSLVSGDGLRLQVRRSSPPTGCRSSCRC